MDGLVNFSVAFVLVAFAVVVLMGKADWMMAKYRLTFKDGKPKFVKYREYDAERTNATEKFTNPSINVSLLFHCFHPNSFSICRPCVMRR